MGGGRRAGKGRAGHGSKCAGGRAKTDLRLTARRAQVGAQPTKEVCPGRLIGKRTRQSIALRRRAVAARASASESAEAQVNASKLQPLTGGCQGLLGRALERVVPGCIGVHRGQLASLVHVALARHVVGDRDQG
eukprot:scaffold16763_cov117-Isochrysis_galbana.AAC.2